ncbi:MAG: FAD-dependent monooxygenase, partial [Gammaproteobacteria bacterium]|nr:FAD-dependent monooxygenase [Gammaproteobacteria bacterium]
MPERVPVVIIGGGPVGMTAALLLARVGVQSVVVEKRQTTRPDPQAHVIKVRSVEILRGLGLEDDLRAASTPPEQIRYVTWV